MKFNPKEHQEFLIREAEYRATLIAQPSKEELEKIKKDPFAYLREKGMRP